MGHSDSSPHMESTSVVCKLLRVTLASLQSSPKHKRSTRHVIEYITFNRIALSQACTDIKGFAAKQIS